MLFRQWLESWQDELEDTKGLQQIMALLQKWRATDVRQAPYLTKPVLLFNMDGEIYVIDDFQFPTPQTAEEFVTERQWKNDAWEYLPERNFSQQFWSSVGQGSMVFHGTTKDNWESIQNDGFIGCRAQTRGMSNKKIGCVVFTSLSYESTIYHYDIALEINLGAMKSDGYMPEVAQEPDVEAAAMLGSIAHAIDLEDWSAEIEQGMDEETVIFYGNIPTQYVQLA